MANTEVVMKNNLGLRQRKRPKRKRILLKPLLGTELY